MVVVACEAGEGLIVLRSNFRSLTQLQTALLGIVHYRRVFHDCIRAVQLLLIVLHGIGQRVYLLVVEVQVQPSIFFALRIPVGGQLCFACKLVVGYVPVFVYLLGLGEVVLFGERLTIRAKYVLAILIHIVYGDRPCAGGRVVYGYLLILLGQYSLCGEQRRGRSPTLELGESVQSSF